jgi:hypothetical protein
MLLRAFEEWTEEDLHRFNSILNFLSSRAQYGPSTFRHKVLFLEGAPFALFMLANLSRGS